ncbi:trypsin-like peptidase domain-containing protein [Proteiniclasticum sp. SCR006]|uniref:Trypsin-like peptidase domain-containing protein n=1 Tax=Proteiniclasticum aestuarii TaxID=2817862 RepID=A0A939KIL3_9CLOT|nr:trypsin-like peptidase domain-containing protein [Proteiniclasticum aestuarii]MBO1264268.1 trypsin-like peptidase domain-containing protein [Proteiniclasticum aestuarii]
MSYKDPYGQDPDREENKDQNENMNYEKEDTQDYRNVPEYAREVSEPTKDMRDPRNEDAYVYRGASHYEGGQNGAGSGKRKKRFSGLSMIAVALIFTLLGTSLGIYSAYNVLPGTSFFENSKLGEIIQESADGENPVQISTPQLREDGLSVPEIVSMVQPAVVTVSVKVPGGATWFNPQGGYSESIGTGFILSEDGLIATNYHVVDGAEEIVVILYTGEEVSAKVVNYDASNDLAVIQMDEDVKVPGIVTLGDSDSVVVGESVIAIGNPLSKEFAGSVTSGIISATQRTIAIGNREYNYFQTDAAINGGNSGGPLINAKGEVIGINSAKINSQEVEGIGFAIPINTLTNDLDALSRAQLLVGIAGREINEATAEQNDLPVGVLVVEVQDNTPAYLASMMVGDVITEFDGQKVTSVQDINAIKNTKSKGDVVTVKVYREGEYLDLKLTLVERP